MSKEQTVELKMPSCTVRLTGRHPTYLESISHGDAWLRPLLALAEKTPAGSVYLDVGANIGATAIAVALSRPDLRVIAFEPEPGNAELLRRNVATNKARNCTVVEAAVGAERGATTINENGPWSMVGRPGISVPVLTLDDWCAEYAAEATVGLIKIDAEGCEPRVVAGSWRAVQRWRPAIVLEFNSFCLLMQGFNPMAFASYLIDRFHVATPEGVRISSHIGIVHDNIAKRHGVSDFIILPKGEERAPELSEIGAFANIL